MGIILFPDNQLKKTNTLILRDTIIREIKSDPLILEKVKTKILYKKDTIIKSKPFSAILDTVIKKDSIKIEYEFPENYLSFQLNKMMDTLVIPREIEIEIEKDEKEAWWEKPAIALGSLFIGYYISELKNE